MSQKSKNRGRSFPSSTAEVAVASSDARSLSGNARLLHDRAAALIADEQIPDAMNVLRGQAHSDPWLRNLLGVCLLRSNRPEDAMDLLRPNAWSPNGMIRTDVPVEFVTNFVTSLLMQGRVNAATNALSALREEAHPAVRRLRAAIADWMNGLSFWSRWSVRLGIDPTEGIPLGFTLGEVPSELNSREPA
jgi:hypothetical protein